MNYKIQITPSSNFPFSERFVYNCNFKSINEVSLFIKEVVLLLDKMRNNNPVIEKEKQLFAEKWTSERAKNIFKINYPEIKEFVNKNGIKDEDNLRIFLMGLEGCGKVSANEIISKINNEPLL